MNGKEVSEALGDVNGQFIAEALTYKRRKLPLWFPIAAVAACLCLLVGLLPSSWISHDIPTGVWNFGGTEAYYGYGVPIDGLILGSGTDSVEIRDLQLTLDLTASPLDNDRISGNTATMEYTFHNPTDKTISLTITLPAGQDPLYAGSFEYGTGISLFDANRNLYTVNANGTPLDFRLRLTGSDAPPQSEEEWSTGLFSNHTPVTIFTYRVQNLETGETAYASIWGPGTNKRVILPEGHWFGVMINGYTEKYRQVSVGDTVVLYVFGSAADFNPAWRFYTDFSRDQITSGTMELINTQQMTFLEYAAQSWDADSGVSQSDWACALAGELKRSSYSDGVASLSNYPDTIWRWFEYELTLAPGETVVNTVTMPAYPAVSLSNGSQWFQYTLDILSLRTPLPQAGPDIIVNTPYTMTESSEEFTETEAGYVINMTMPYNVTLKFTLKEPQAESPPPEAPAPQPQGQVHWLTVLGGAAFAVLGLYWLLRRRTQEC